MHKLLPTLALALLATIGSLRACGLDWSVPALHFDAVQEQGRVSYHEEWSAVTLASGKRLPLVVNFDSGREWTSPHLGHGWMLALVDSYAVRLSEGEYLAVMPDGYHYRFVNWIGPKEVWNGNRGWLGRETDGGFQAWAPCGWSVRWHQGRIEKITTPGGTVIDFRRRDGVVREVREDGRLLLEIEPDPITGLAARLRAGGERIVLRHAPRPLVRDVAGRRLVGTQAPVLAEAAWTGGRRHRYRFSTDGELNPVLEVETGPEARQLVWDPDSRHILRDGGWTYAIEPGDHRSDFARISRTHADGRRESWHHDWRRGRETTRGSNGVVTVREQFVAGPLAGRTRRLTRRWPDGATWSQVYIYDEEGRVLRLRRDTAAGAVTHAYQYGEDSDRPWGVVTTREGQRSLLEFAARPDGQPAPEADRVTRREPAREVAAAPTPSGYAVQAADGRPLYHYDATSQSLTILGGTP